MSNATDPFAELRDVAKAQVVLANIAVGIIPVLQIVVPFVLWYTFAKAKIATWQAAGTNLERAWAAMQYGHLAAFAPAAIMWIPSFFGEKVLSIYVSTLKFAKEAGQYAMLAVVTFLLMDAGEAGTGTPRTKPIWYLMLFYIEVQAILAWVVPHFQLDQAAMLIYMWDFI